MHRMFSIVISLAHFCDKHGPRIISVTQSAEKGTLGEELLVPDYPTESYCESCLLQFPEESTRSMRCFIEDVPFITTQYSSIRYQLLNSIIKRAFSEETMIYDNMPFIFFDDLRGLNLVIGFKLYDENARGNERRYCFILTVDSRSHDDSMKMLSEHWNFIIGGFDKMIAYFKNIHKSEFLGKNKTVENNLETLNNNAFIGSYLRANKSKFGRNLVSLTDDKFLFVRIHKWNSFLLHTVMNENKLP